MFAVPPRSTADYLSDNASRYAFVLASWRLTVTCVGLPVPPQNDLSCGALSSPLLPYSCTVPVEFLPRTCAYDLVCPDCKLHNYKLHTAACAKAYLVHSFHVSWLRHRHTLNVPERADCDWAISHAPSCLASGYARYGGSTQVARCSYLSCLHVRIPQRRGAFKQDSTDVAAPACASARAWGASLTHLKHSDFSYPCETVGPFSPWQSVHTPT